MILANRDSEVKQLVNKIEQDHQASSLFVLLQQRRDGTTLANVIYNCMRKGARAPSLIFISAAPHRLIHRDHGGCGGEKAGAAGSLEATGYELGAGLGITFFGVAVSAIYLGALVLPAGIPAGLADAASHLIGDTYVLAGKLPQYVAAALVAAGKSAFSQAYAVLLTAAGTLVGLLSAAVFLALKNVKAGH